MPRALGRVMAAPMFWISTALVFFAYAGYPIVLLLVTRLRSKPIARRRIFPKVTFVITAHNEARRLRQKLENTVAQDYPASLLEIIVASDCSTDGTDDIARSFGGRVRLVRARERRGKEAAQQIAVEAASGDVLVFSDVATAIALDGISSIVANFADPSVGCVSSVDRFVDADGRTSGEGAYVRYEMFLRTLETRVNSLVGLSGSFFAARREVCRRWAADRQSDFSTLLNAVELGYRGVLDPDTAGYYRNIADDRRESARKVRTVVRGLAVLARNWRMLNPFRYGMFAWQLASHKLCRWLVPFAMIAAFASNAALLASPFYRAAFAAQIAFYGAAIVGLWTGADALRIPAYFVRSNLAILIAWLHFARGERMTSWTPSDRLTALPHTNPQ
ncbi:MAG TPA: glycosyltransferase [Vicinamibacterales bacterium]|nr:glycosyltransferase [Vicinamibacterales bacterium]